MLKPGGYLTFELGIFYTVDAVFRPYNYIRSFCHPVSVLPVDFPHSPFDFVPDVGFSDSFRDDKPDLPGGREGFEAVYGNKPFVYSSPGIYDFFKISVAF